jgi:hypothetical protein
MALSMLQGGPPVPIKQLVDLAKLPSFFDDPRKSFDKTWLDPAPGLSRVIARMLCIEEAASSNLDIPAAVQLALHAPRS